jgi:hypothetical protein
MNLSRSYCWSQQTGRCAEFVAFSVSPHIKTLAQIRTFEKLQVMADFAGAGGRFELPANGLQSRCPLKIRSTVQTTMTTRSTKSITSLDDGEGLRLVRGGGSLVFRVILIQFSDEPEQSGRQFLARICPIIPFEFIADLFFRERPMLHFVRCL